MKKTITMFLMAGTLVSAAQATAATGAKSKAPAKKTAKTAAPQPLTIPKDATANPDGTYSWTDAQSHKWLYVKTPFGITRTEVTQAPAEANPLAGVTAFDAGDKVRFERASPFGVTKWEKNKTDLTDEERALLTAQTPNKD